MEIWWYISFQEYVSKGISHPLFWCDLVYNLRRVNDTPNFISLGSKIVKRLWRRQYDPLIIERTIGLVFGPSTALYRPFLKHCTLTNTLRRGLYDRPCPKLLRGDKILFFNHLWLLAETPSAIRPELASRRVEHSPLYSDVTIFIFDFLYLLPMLFVYRFYDLSAWCGCWFVVYIRRFIYNFLNVCPFDYMAVAGSGKVMPLNRLNTPVGWLYFSNWPS